MEKHLSEEKEMGRLTKVDSIPQHIHAMGVVPKDVTSFRPITDCSRPTGTSINSFMTETC